MTTLGQFLVRGLPGLLGVPAEAEPEDTMNTKKQKRGDASAFIRQHPTLSATGVVDAAAKKGVRITADAVYKTRSYDKNKPLAGKQKSGRAGGVASAAARKTKKKEADMRGAHVDTDVHIIKGSPEMFKRALGVATDKDILAAARGALRMAVMQLGYQEATRQLNEWYQENKKIADRDIGSTAFAKHFAQGMT